MPSASYNAYQAGYTKNIRWEWSADYTVDIWQVSLDGTVVAGGRNSRGSSGTITVPDYGTYTVGFTINPYNFSKNVIVEEPPPPPSTGPYIWDGTEWKEATPYIWTGSAWVPATANIWDGSAWQS